MKSDIENASIRTIAGLGPQGYAIGVDFVDRRPTWLELAYPIEWSRHYVDHGLISDDPTIEFGLTTQGHITWGELLGRYPDNRVLTGASKFGLTHGNTLSIAINGQRSILSTAGAPWSDGDIEIARSALSALHALHALHARKRTDNVPDHVLSTVRLMVTGLRDDQIAERLGVKVETIRQRRQKAYSISGTNTPAGLGAYAQKAGWLTD